MLALAAIGCGSVSDTQEGSAADASVSIDAAGAVDAAVDAGACPPGFVGDGNACVDVVSELAGRRVEELCTKPGIEPYLCVVMPDPDWTGTAGGAPGMSYLVHLRVRGVVERRVYSGGTPVGDFFYVGGGGQDQAGANIFQLHIGTADVYRDYYFNAGPKTPIYASGLDYAADVEVHTGDALLLRVVDDDAVGIRNVDASNNPILVPGVSPYPDPFDGQFVQIDVTGVDELPAP